MEDKQYTMQRTTGNILTLFNTDFYVQKTQQCVHPASVADITHGYDLVSLESKHTWSLSHPAICAGNNQVLK